MAEKTVGTEDLLENFRRQWETDISAARSRSSRNKPQTFQDEKQETGANKENTDEEQATDMYLRGVKHEESGEVVEAIKFYKRAMQLVPDIEQRIYTYPKNKENSTNISTKSAESLEKVPLSTDNNNLDDLDEGTVNLLEKFQRILQQGGRICTPEDESKGTHISALPREIFVYLLKWVVSSDLDLRSLEQVSLVCRGLYVCSRDSEIWRSACLSIWNGQGVPKTFGFTNYRDMFILRPRLQFSGCYISKTSYVRPGENSFQDANYQPWHMVNYYRYIRFYPDRTAVMSTTADIPNVVVGKRLRKKDPSCSPGVYSLQGNVVTCIFKRKRVSDRVEHVRNRRRNEEVNNNETKIVEQVFQLELEIKTVKKRLHCALYWNRYTIQTVYQDREPSTAHFDINPTRFPPLWFSRVKSYNSQSEKPL